MQQIELWPWPDDDEAPEPPRLRLVRDQFTSGHYRPRHRPLAV